MRVYVAPLAPETNTFSPLYVDRSAFESAFYCPPGSHPAPPTLCMAPVVATRRRVQADGFTLIEGITTWAEPAGIVAREAHESLRDEILGQLKRAFPADVVLFGLHGFMVARDYDDCEGDLMALWALPRCTLSRAGADYTTGSVLTVDGGLTAAI